MVKLNEKLFASVKKSLWMVPMFLFGAIICFSTSCSSDSSSNSGNASQSTDSGTSSTISGTTESGDSNASASSTSFSFNENGDLLDANGNIIKSAKDLALDANGNITDAQGNILAKKGNFRGAAASLPKLDASVVSNAASDMANKAKDAMSDLAVYHVDEASGNLVDEAGKVILEKGAFEQDDEGYFVDKKSGKRIGRFLKKVGKAIAKAAGATADALKNTFSGLFKKKKSGEEVEPYTLNDMEFNTDPKATNLITKFSVAEIQGLANALKDDKDAKIEVRAYTNDGNNKVLSKSRAKLITQQLVTLGVDAKQISAKGLGNTDAKKAANNIIEIAVN